MPFARLASTVRLAATASLFAALTLACWAQEPPAAPTPQNTSNTAVPVLDYSKPASHFPNPIGPYMARHVAAPNLANTARIDRLMHDGKLYLSLNDAIALALWKTISTSRLQRYNLNIADTDVLRAKAGAQILGVNARRRPEHSRRRRGRHRRRSDPAPAARTSAPAARRRRRRHGRFHRVGFSDRSSPASIRSSRGPSRRTTSANRRPAFSNAVLPGNSCAKHRHGEFAYSRASSGARTFQVGFNNTRDTTNSFFPTSVRSSELQLPVQADTASACRDSDSPPTPASSASPRTTANFLMSPSACRSSTASTRSKTCTGIWSTPTRTRACRTNRCLRAEDAFRHQEAGGDRQPGADRSRPRAEHGRSGPAGW